MKRLAMPEAHEQVEQAGVHEQVGAHRREVLLQGLWCSVGMLQEGAHLLEVQKDIHIEV